MKKFDVQVLSDTEFYSLLARQQYQMDLDNHPDFKDLTPEAQNVLAKAREQLDQVVLDDYTHHDYATHYGFYASEAYEQDKISYEEYEKLKLGFHDIAVKNEIQIDKVSAQYDLDRHQALSHILQGFSRPAPELTNGVDQAVKLNTHLAKEFGETEGVAVLPVNAIQQALDGKDIEEIAAEAIVFKQNEISYGKYTPDLVGIDNTKNILDRDISIAVNEHAKRIEEEQKLQEELKRDNNYANQRP